MKCNVLQEMVDLFNKQSKVSIPCLDTVQLLTFPKHIFGISKRFFSLQVIPILDDVQNKVQNAKKIYLVAILFPEDLYRFKAEDEQSHLHCKINIHWLKQTCIVQERPARAWERGQLRMCLCATTASLALVWSTLTLAQPYSLQSCSRFAATILNVFSQLCRTFYMKINTLSVV